MNKMNKREKKYAKQLNQEGKTYLFEPVKFKLKPPLMSYTPDFYIFEDNSFIELSGTRQAFNQGKSKYEAFREEYPQFNLQVVSNNGCKYETRGRKRKMRFSCKETSKPIRRKRDKCKDPHIYKVLSHIINNNLNMGEMASLLDISLPTLTTYLNGQTKKTPTWWFRFEAIASNYEEQEWM